MYGAFVWARRALNGPKRRFPARAEIESLDAASHSIEFGTTEGGWVKGGWQGGRGWQVDHAKINSTTENYLLAGGWMIDNVREEVDAPNEYYYDKAEHKLYLIPNKTMAAGGGAPDPAIRLVTGKLQTLISLTGRVSPRIDGLVDPGLDTNLSIAIFCS